LRLIARRLGKTAVWSLAVAALAVALLFANHPGSAEPQEPAAPAFAGGWQTPVHVSTTSPSGAFLPVIDSAPNGLLLIAYNHKTGVANDPFYTISGNSGASWTTPAPIHTGGQYYQVDVAFDSSNTAHAVWRDSTSIYHATQSQWATNGVNPVASGSTAVFDPSIAVGPNNWIHVAWVQVGSSGHSIQYAFSTNSGASWSSPAQLDDADHLTYTPSVTVDQNGKVHVAWEHEELLPSLLSEYRINYRSATYTGGGFSWSPALGSDPFVMSGSQTRAHRPIVMADGANLHAAFSFRNADGLQDAYYTRFSPGSGWLAPQMINGGQPLAVNTNQPFYLVPTLAACDNQIFVYYHGALAVNEKELVMGSSSGNWSALDYVTDSASRHVNPALTCASSRLHMVYERVPPLGANHQVYYVAGNANGVFLPVIRR
jgi:hypothetical protein